MNRLVLILMTLATQFLFAQDGRYAFFLSDKEGTNYSIGDPSAFLSEKSISRRIKNGVSVTMEDLPVSQEYVSQIEEKGAVIFQTSRWLNAVVAEVESNEVNEILSLPFVTSSSFLSPISTSSGGRVKKFKSRKDSNLGIVNSLQTAMLGLDDMHNDGFMGEGISIGVFDSGFIGVNVTSPFQSLINEGRITMTLDLVSQSENVFQYDDHGTEVLSIMAANEPGVYRGGAPKATYQLYVTEDVSSEYRIEEFNWLIAAEKADSAGVDIISSSLGYNLFDDAAMNYSTDQLDGKTAVVSIAASIALSKGMLVVCSAGNEGNVQWKLVTPPADADGVLSVGAVTSSGNLSGFSSVGPSADGRIKPDVVALGSGVSVIKTNGTSGFTSGTSASTPLITSLAAGLLQAFPDLSARALYDLIITSGNISQIPNNQFGYGIPNYLTAKEVMIGGDPVVKNPPIVIYPNPVTGDSLRVEMDIPVGQSASISIYSLQGQLVFQSAGAITYSNNPVDLDLALFSAGLYIVRIETLDMVKTFRLIKL